MQRLTKIKDQGNQLFKQKKFSQAIQKFIIVIKQIQSDQSKQYLLPETESSKLYVIALINCAFASINSKTIQHYDKAIENCSKALAIDTKNVKALYRRGLAKKQKGEKIESDEENLDYTHLLEIYESGKIDFENLCLIDKENQLAKKNLSQIIKNIYRVTVAKGQEVDLTRKPTQTQTKQKKSPYQISNDAPKKRNPDMTKIMKQYKVEQVTNMVKDKVNARYLQEQLPKLKSDFEKAIRQVQKSQQIYIRFIYRLDQNYLNKIQPNFDCLARLITILVKKGEGQKAKQSFLALRQQKSFGLYWKSLTKKQKQQVKDKWTSLGLKEQQLK